jgi:hypothetical protein
MIIELTCIGDVISGINEETGEPKFVKKNIQFSKTFSIEGLTHEHYIDAKGKILKSYCNVYSGGQQYKVKHSYEYISNLIRPIKVKGFIKHAKKGKYKV